MENWIKSGLIMALFTAITFSTVAAQKYGHLNSGNLILSMPETKVADNTLETYQNQLISDLKKKTEIWETEASKLQQDFNAGTVSQVKAQEKQAALQKRGQELQKEEIGISDKVAKKRQELLEPILNKLDTALKEVAKEEGYTMIFDTGIFNALLYVEEADDVLPLIKAKLGLK